MKVNGIEVEVCGPYMEPHAPFGRVTFTSEERHCFWLDKGKKRSCGITKTADGRFVSGTFSEMPLAKTVRGVLRKIVGKGLYPLT